MSELDNPEISAPFWKVCRPKYIWSTATCGPSFGTTEPQKITGYLSQDVVGAFCRDQLLAGDERTRNVLSDAARGLSEVFRDRKPSVMDVSLRHRLGHRIFVRLRAVPVRNSHGSIIAAAESIEEDIAASDWNRDKKN